MEVTQLDTGGSVYGGDSSLRRALTFTETHFYEGGSSLRRQLISTVDAHFNGGDSFPRRKLTFLRKRLISMKVLVYTE